MTASEIAKELNVDAVVEGSVLCLGDSICSQFRLVKTSGEERQIWNADYQEGKSQILNFYNRITRRIADEVKIELTTKEEKILTETRTIDPQAYDAYMKGQYYWEQLSADSIHLALQYFELAIQKEPDWADPYVGLAQAWGQYGRHGFIPRSIARANKVKYLEKAMELNPESAKVHYGKANHAVWTDWDWEQGEKAYIYTLELTPN